MPGTKIDLKRELHELYVPGREPVLVDVPELPFLAVDGQGDPNTSAAYAEAIEALFSVSYAIKFALKRGPAGLDYAVMPLEGLWWADDTAAFPGDDKASWSWTAMIAQPPEVTVLGPLGSFRVFGSAANDHTDITGTYSWSDNLSWIHGKQTIRGGVSLLRQENGRQETGNARGKITFQTFNDFLLA